MMLYLSMATSGMSISSNIGLSFVAGSKFGGPRVIVAIWVSVARRGGLLAALDGKSFGGGVGTLVGLAEARGGIGNCAGGEESLGRDGGWTEAVEGSVCADSTLVLTASGLVVRFAAEFFDMGIDLAVLGSGKSLTVELTISKLRLGAL